MLTNIDTIGIDDAVCRVQDGGSLALREPMKSIFFRTYLAIALCMIVGFFFALVIADNLLEESDGDFFERLITAEAHFVEEHLQGVSPDQWVAALSSYEPHFDTEVSVLQKQEVLDSEFASIVSLTADTLVTAESFEDWWLLRPLPGGELFLLLEESDEPGSWEDVATILAPLFALMLIVAVGLWSVSRFIEAPVHELALAAQAIRSGDLTYRTPIRTTEPFRQLGLNFNLMAEHLQRVISDQRVIIGALPHELRSPIGRARFALDLTRNTTNLERMRGQLEDVDRYVDELERVIEDTLCLAQIQSNDSTAATTFDLEQMLVEVCVLTSEHQTVNIDIRCPIDSVVVSHEPLLRLAIGNLWKNALTFGNTQVQVMARIEDQDMLSIRVEDDGVGIAEEHRAAVFAPFYRIDASRSRDTGGIGLGLAIVAFIARELGGSVEVESSELGGACFVFRWVTSQH